MTAFVAASGGLMFGYDNGVSGGVSAMDPFLEKFFPEVSLNPLPTSDTNCEWSLTRIVKPSCVRLSSVSTMR